MEKVELYHNITSLYKLNLKCEETNIWIKRDDNLDFAFGGNKVRLYEYIAKYIQNSRATKVVTYGSCFSNYLRVTAAVCSRLGVECDLIVLEENENEKIDGGNQLLLENFNAKILHCLATEAHEFIGEYQKKLETVGCQYVWIPGGGHMAEAAFGYVDAAVEIQAQVSGSVEEVDAIFLPCGTGTTQAGLVYEMSKVNVPVIGITVARPCERCETEIAMLLAKMEKLEGKSDKKREYLYKVIGENEGGYGKITRDMQECMKTLANSDGIFLDPIYNAKAFDGMLKYLRKNGGYKNVIYLNTGGTPNIFLERKKA